VGWRLVDLVHVLAQLPASLRLDLEGDRDQLNAVPSLSRAYGLGDRVSLREGVPGRAAWRFEGASRDAPAWAAHDVLDDLPRTMGEVVELLWPDGTPAVVGHSEDEALSGHRVAIVTNLPAHYRIPLFTGLARRLAAAGASLRVFFLASDAAGRPWLRAGEDLEFDHDFLKSIPMPVRRRRPPFLPFELRRRLGAFEPTIVLAAGFSPFSTTHAAAYARRRRVPFGLWSGETPALAPQGRRSKLRTAQRRRLAARADFGIAYGSLAVRYLRALAPELPVVIGRNTSVASAAEGREPVERGALELIAVADLSVPGKGIELVAEALTLAKDIPCSLNVVGTRPAAGSVLEQSVRDDRIRFLGPLPHGEVMAALAQSDVFVFPSRVDPFGLALVEAMASELAVIVSPAPGAVADLAVSGHNCLVVDRDDPQSWADRIRELADDPGLRRRLAARARETIARRWTTDHAVEGMLAGLRLGAMADGKR
jgi:glycosyltransferase involved in cell wall biosynthesis